MKRGIHFRRLCATFAVAASMLAGPAMAGPPFVTDDPEPTDTGHWEIYNFVEADHTPGDTAGQAGFDINYGGAKDLQLTAVVPLDFESGEETGVGDIELAAKYKFLHQSDGSLTPDVAIFPRVFVPTAGRQYGPRTVSLFVPIWAQKNFGKWSVFGGGGYEFHPGADNRNFWLSGVGVTRTISDRLTLGVEAYHQTANTLDGRPFTGLNLGLLYKLTKHWGLLVAAGPGVQNPREGGQYDAYLSLEAVY